MPSAKVVDVISRAQTVLQDVTGVRWPVLELQYWLNDFYKEAVLLRPAVSAVQGGFACVPGTRQTLTTQYPAAVQLLAVVRNTAAASSKRAIRAVTRKQLDDQRPDWHNEKPTVNIQLFVFNPALPKEFLVYPPAADGASVEVELSVLPAAHTLTEVQLTDPATAELFRLDPQYANPALDYILYRAYSKDADHAANVQRAVAHYTAMQTSLGAGGAA